MKYESSYLSHHGIKGQQWGVRRFQNEDGSLTAEGRQRYDVGEERQLSQISDKQKIKLRESYRLDRNSNLWAKKKLAEEKAKGKKPNKHRLELEEKYLKQGMSKEDAKYAAFRQDKIDKTLKVVGAVALTAAVAYAAFKGHQYISRYGNKHIWKGNTVYRITKNADDMTRGHGVYLTTNKADAVKYKGLWGRQQLDDEAMKVLSSRGQIKPQDVYQVKGTADKTLKIAGERVQSKLYKNLMKNDPSFRKLDDAVRAQVNHIDGMHDFGDPGLHGFNRRLVVDSSEGRELSQKFYAALKKKGYGGLMDINDRDYSGYKAKKAMIVFDLKDKIKNMSAEKLTASSVQQAGTQLPAIFRSQGIREARLASVGKYLSKASKTLGIGGGLGLIFSKSQEYERKSNQSKYNMLIRDYKKEHPNTKLSDKKILENLLG